MFPSLPAFFKKIQNKKFNYLPVFYDEAKEDLNERVKNAKIEMGEEDKNVQDIKSNIRKGFTRNHPTFQRQQKTSNFRIITIILILCAIGYLAIKYNLI